jgi:DNA-binding response OmpR family regulator
VGFSCEKSFSTCLSITHALRAFANGTDMLLKPKEFALLLLFVQNLGKTISFETLYEGVWKAPLNNDSRTLRKHISVIRKQLEETDSGFTIENDRGEGYALLSV